MTVIFRLGKYLMLSFVFSALAFYLFQIEKLTSDNYLAEKCEKEIKILSDENSALEQTYLKNISVKETEEKVKELGFVRVSTVKHIPISFDYLAKETTVTR